MKKRVIVILLIVAAIILLIPVPVHFKDGGTVKYQAILYSITDYHSIKVPDGFYTGVEIKVLGITVYENTTFDD